MGHFQELPGPRHSILRYVTPGRGDGNTIIGRTGGLIRPDNLVSHVRALEGRWISS